MGGLGALAQRVLPAYRENMSETIADRIYRALLEQIITGVLAPGEKLRQDHVARAHETSHVPVREAFLRLQARGLAVSVPHKGMRVTTPEPEEIREIVEMRVALELLALGHAMALVEADDLKHAETCLRACDDADDMAQWERLDREFHMALLAPCRMPRLLNAIADLHIAGARHFFAHWGARWKPRPDPDHRLLLEAVRQGDTQEASAVLRRHLRRVG